MRRIFYLFLLIPILTTIGLAQPDGLTITSFRITDPQENTGYGNLLIRVGKIERAISDIANKAWIIRGGRAIIFAGADGAGGYENEGQSLWIYEAETGLKRKILSQYYMIEAVAEKKLSNGKIVLLVRMSDGAAGASCFSVVDPDRGETFFREAAELLTVVGDRINLAFYSDWHLIDSPDDAGKLIPDRSKFKPVKKESFDLKELVVGEVIYHPHHIRQQFLKNENFKTVKVYFWRPDDLVPGRKYTLRPAYRYVDPQAPLKPTLAALFGKIKKEESDYGFSSPTFGLKFEGVSLKRGTAVVKISQETKSRHYGDHGFSIMVEAVTKTVRQFPTVKRIRLCAVGEVFIDDVSGKRFPECVKSSGGRKL